MDLIKDNWSKEDIVPFQNYLLSLSKGKEKCIWEQKIVNTNMQCIAISADNILKIVNQISKGNFLDFINLNIWEYHQNTIINGKLICKIKDFKLMKNYLIDYASKVDNWASIDGLKFNINKQNTNQYLNLSKELITHKKPFVRRLALVILLKILNKDNIKDVLEIAKSLKNESHFYVNMANAWLLCDCLIKFNDFTLKILNLNNLNYFVFKKTISKAIDSFRISAEDKIMLKDLRQKVKEDNNE